MTFTQIYSVSSNLRLLTTGMALQTSISFILPSALFKYFAQEIQTETRAMVGQIEETKEYINTQLNESRFVRGND